MQGVLARLGGVADARTLVGLTSRRQVRTAVAKGLVERDGRGHYALPVASQAVRAANRLHAVVGLASAAAYWGWELKQPPTRPTVIVPAKRRLPRERRGDVDVRWRDVRSAEVSDGIVTAPHTTVIHCAIHLPFDEALAIADSALRHDDVTRAGLLAVADRVRGRGRTSALRVAREADVRAANPFESVLRAIALDVPGLCVAPQVEILDGDFFARPDLVDEALRLVVEAESVEFHTGRRAFRRDCRRYSGLVARGWRVLRFAWEDVMFEPTYVRDTLRAAVDEARGPQRQETSRKGGRKSG